MSDNLKEDVEKILADFGRVIVDNDLSILDDPDHDFKPSHDKAEAVAIKKLLALINQKEKELLEKFDEVIGKDENLDKAIFGGVLAEQLKGQKGLMTSYEIARNRLRAEQRDRIKQLKEELKEKQL